MALHAARLYEGIDLSGKIDFLFGLQASCRHAETEECENEDILSHNRGVFFYKRFRI